MDYGGVAVKYSKTLNGEETLKEVVKYLNTGTWDKYGPKAAPDIAKQIADDINARGASVTSTNNYLVTTDGSNEMVAIKQDKSGKWVAKPSFAFSSIESKGSNLSQIGDVISKSLTQKSANKKKGKS